MHRAKDITIIVLLVAVVYLIATREQTDSAENVRRASSIAVLPFVNMSSDPENEYLSDDIWDKIISALVTVPEIKVASRTSSSNFKGSGMDIESIGEALGVTYILEGSVRRTQEEVQITAQLVRVDDGAHLWWHNYERSLNAAESVPTVIARSVAREIEKLQ